MNATLRSALAVLALAAAAPAGAAANTPDFGWYANAGSGRFTLNDPYPAPRAGYIWAPGRYEWNGGPGQTFRPGRWIIDDYEAQWRLYAFGHQTVLANGPLVLRDRDGNVIPINADAYPVGSAGK
jgi:hypothetical protein